MIFSKELRIIGESAFGHCYNLKNIELPEGLLYIDTLCFTDCKNLTKVYIPKSVMDVGMSIFLGSGKLKEVTVSKEIADKIDFYENVKVRYIE